MRNQPFHIRNRQRHNRSRLVSDALPHSRARRRHGLRRRHAPVALIQRDRHISARNPFAANRVMRMRRPLKRMQVAMRMRRADMQMPRLPLREMMVKRPSRQRRKQRNHPRHSQQPGQSRSNPFRNHHPDIIALLTLAHTPATLRPTISIHTPQKVLPTFSKVASPPSYPKIPQKQPKNISAPQQNL